MGYAEAEEGLPGISICPRCGARLVTRNHFVLVRAEADLDDELRARLRESHGIVGTQCDLRSE